MTDKLIPELEAGDCADHICVRVSRFWEYYDVADETRLRHADLVLIDEEGNSIHAQIYPNAYARFKALIKEGSVYNLACFWVKNSSDKYKAVTNKFMITLSKWTTIEELVEVPHVFPVFTYSLTPIEQLPSLLVSTEYFIDVIGIVTAISNLTTFRAKGRESDSLKRVVTIQNARKASVDVVLWGERASSFPAEQIQTDGEASPQVIIFVGTLVKKYLSGIALAGNSSCKWYINPEVPEAEALLSSIGDMNQPIKSEQLATPTKTTPAAELKMISEIKDLNPFKNKKVEFLVTVTIRKIDSSWWYNSCEQCVRTTKPYGDSFKCTEPKCAHIGKPIPRYKLSIIAGDDTGDTDFVMFGRWVQRLTKKSCETLIAENPIGFIPKEITRLLEKVFKWNVSFTDNSTSSSKVCFQVNAVLGQINETNDATAITPTRSQSSSLMISEGASSSIQRTPQKSATFPLPSQPTTSQNATHGSSATPSKATLTTPEPQGTPQSRTHTDEDQTTPRKEEELTLPPTDQEIGPANAPVMLAQSAPAVSPVTPQENEDNSLAKNPSKAKEVAANSATKTQKSITGKRSRSSPNKKIAKKLLLDDDPDNKDGGCVDDTAMASTNANA